MTIKPWHGLSVTGSRMRSRLGACAISFSCGEMASGTFATPWIIGEPPAPHLRRRLLPGPRHPVPRPPRLAPRLAQEKLGSRQAPRSRGRHLLGTDQVMVAPRHPPVQRGPLQHRAILFLGVDK